VGNHFAWECFQKVSGQVITTGMGDLLGIKFEAISFLFELYGIIDVDDRIDLFEKIIAIDGERIKMRSLEMSRNNITDKNK